MDHPTATTLSAAGCCATAAGKGTRSDRNFVAHATECQSTCPKPDTDDCTLLMKNHFGAAFIRS
eukprot:4204520-Alexandrium_andersonii.AAC.1